MARKDRAPTPPKRPQAPQRRTTPSSAADAAQRRRLLLIVGAAVLAAAAIALGYVFLGGGDDAGDDVAAVMQDAGCRVQSVPAQTGDHTAELDATKDPKWNTNPPTSGPHYPVPAVYGEYDSPLKVAQVVHNLEHGAIYVLYGSDVPEATVTQLREFYADDRRGVLLAPLPSLGDKIALGAWTVPDDFQPNTGNDGTAYLATCTKYDEDAFETFREELRFRGPERFPPESLEPGVS